MKFAIMADIHANLEAFHAALLDAKAQGCTHHAFLGDIVGYGPDPAECVAIVRALGAPCVRGNCDEYCAGDRLPEGLDAPARKHIEWTRKQLSEDDRWWLQDLPLVRQVADFTIVHATLEFPERWQYVFDNLAASASFCSQKTQVCFCGHTHMPLAFVRDTVTRGGTFTKFKVEKAKEYLINAGSVGQPRDNNLKAAYVVYDMDGKTVELRRVEYDIAATQRKIRDTGF